MCSWLGRHDRRLVPDPVPENRMKVLLTLLAFTAACCTHAAVYQGQSATGRTLIMDEASHTYHYTDERLPYPLVPQTGNCPAEARCYRTSDHLTLEQRGKNWRIQDGMALAPYAPHDDDPANRLYAAEMPYETALLDDLAFTPAKTTAHNDKIVELQYLREPQSGFEHFLISGGYKDKRDTINQYLRAQALAALYARRQCLAALPAGKRAALDYRVDMEPTYLGPRYISAHIHEKTNCGYGGHYGITYDIGQARGLELEDLLWIGGGTPHLLADDSPDDQALRETRAAWLLDALKNAAPHAMGRYPYRAEDYQYPYYYLTPHGLYIGPLLPPGKAAHAHPEDTILPYDLVRQHPGILGADAIP